jgi:hypothetical protein
VPAYHIMNVTLHAFLTSVIEVSGQLHVPTAFLPEKESLEPAGWKGGFVSPRAGQDAVAKWKIPAHTGNITLVVHLVTTRFTGTYLQSWRKKYKKGKGGE